MTEFWPYPGSRWWKFDFHTHTPASDDYGKGSDQAQLKQITCKDWLLSFMRQGIDCVAVTDHNSGAWVDSLKQALEDLESERHSEYRPLYIFPGVEITVHGNIHVLAIFDLNKNTSDIDSLLGAVGYRGNKGRSDSCSACSAVEVINEIVKAGGLAIPAHADQQNGLFKLFSGNTLEQVLDEKNVIAIEVVDQAQNKPTLYINKKVNWTEVLGSDSHHPSGSNGQRFPGSHFTWVKMAEPSLEGLRLALIDGNGISVRCCEEVEEDFSPFKTPEHFLESLTIENARCIGQGAAAEVRWNPYFNAVIGGRGTGKSSLVHALRLVFNRTTDLRHLDEKAEPRLTFERFNQVAKNRDGLGGLRETTVITSVFVRDGVRHRLRWSQKLQAVEVEDWIDNTWQPSTAQTVTAERFPVRIFSQGQIASLVQDQRALLKLVDRAAGVERAHDRFREKEAAFLETRASLRRLEQQLKAWDSHNLHLEDVKRKLARFEGTDHVAVLKDFQRLLRQKRELKRQFDHVNGLGKNLEEFADDLVVEDIPDDLFGDMDTEAVTFLQTLANLVDLAREAARRTGESLRQKSETVFNRLQDSTWNQHARDIETAHSKLKEKLAQSGVSDFQEFGNLIQKRQHFETELKKLESLKKTVEELEKQSSQQLHDLLEQRREMTKLRQDFLTQTLAGNEYVRIQVLPYGRDCEGINDSLRKLLGVPEKSKCQELLDVDENGNAQKGVVFDLLSGLPDDLQKASVLLEQRVDKLKQELIEGCRGVKSWGRLQSHLGKALESRPDLCDQIAVWYPEDGLSVEYSRAANGRKFASIASGSAGQRAAAMLAFLLSFGEEPLVLDQPEDDLDNQLIYDLVVRQIRENKRRRQLIVITHNPNIVVNGDADLVQVMDFAGGQCYISEQGALQESSLRSKVCRVMEGGAEAFARRYHRLGPESTAYVR